MTDNDRGGPVSGGDHNQGDGRTCLNDPDSPCRHDLGSHGPREVHNHPMHPLVDADGHMTAPGREFVQRSGEIMDEAVARARGEVSS